MQFFFHTTFVRLDIRMVFHFYSSICVLDMKIQKCYTNKLHHHRIHISCEIVVNVCVMDKDPEFYSIRDWNQDSISIYQ